MTCHMDLPRGLSGLLATAILSSLSVTHATPAAAQSADDFYKGKQVQFIIPSGEGGGYDTFSRLLAHHLDRHIPSKPTLVTSNMPGASGIRATNWLYTVAPRDGLTMGATYNALILEPLLGSDATRFKPDEFEWIGSMGKQYNTCVVWHTSDIKTIEDAKKREVRVSTTGASGNSARTPLMMNALLGTKYKVISGYKTTGMRLAVERGEVEGICGLSYDTYAAANPEWLQNKKIRFLIQAGMQKIKELPDTPLLMDYVKDKKQRAALKLMSVRDEVGRPHMFPPKVPRYLVQALRKAFMDTMADPKFLADSKRLKVTIDPLDGSEVQKLIVEAYKAPKDVVAEAARIWPPVKKKKN